MVAQLLGDSTSQDSGHQLAQAWLHALFATHCQSPEGGNATVCADPGRAAAADGLDAQGDQLMEEATENGIRAVIGDTTNVGQKGGARSRWGGVEGTPYEAALIALLRACRWLASHPASNLRCIRLLKEIRQIYVAVIAVSGLI